MTGVTAFVLSFLSSFGAGQSPHGAIVSLDAECRSIAQELGCRVTYPKSLSSQMVYVRRPTTASADQMLYAIAKSLYLQVNRSGNQLELTEDADSRKTALEELLRGRIKLLSDQIAERQRFQGAFKTNLVESIRQLYNVDAGRANPQSVTSSDRYPEPKAYLLMPGEALIQDLLTRIGLSSLAIAQSEHHVVYEDGPVVGALPLPSHTDLDKAYQTQLGYIGSFDDSSKLLDAIKRDGRTPFFLGLGTTLAPVERSRLDLVMHEGTGFFARLEGYDRDGGKNLFATFYARNTGPVLSPDQIAATALADQRSQWKPLSDPTQFGEYIQLPSPLPSWITRPDIAEPLNLFVADAVEGMTGSADSKIAVVSVPDIWLYSEKLVRDGQMNISGFEKLVSQWSDYDSISSSEETIWRPKDPRLIGAMNMDRQAGARLAKKLALPNADLLRVVAKYVHDSGPWTRLSSQLKTKLLSAYGLQRQESPLDTESYRLIGSISDSDWMTLCSGKSLRADQLGISSDVERYLSSDSPMIREPHPVVYDHIQELFTNGQYGLATVSISTNSTTVICEQAIQQKRDKWAETSIDLLAQNIMPPGLLCQGAMKEIRLQRADAEAIVNTTYRFRLGERKSRRVVIALPQGYSVVVADVDSALSLGSEKSYFDLPESVRDEVWKSAVRFTREALDQAKKARD